MTQVIYELGNIQKKRRALLCSYIICLPMKYDGWTFTLCLEILIRECFAVYKHPNIMYAYKIFFEIGPKGG